MAILDEASKLMRRIQRGQQQVQCRQQEREMDTSAIRLEIEHPVMEE
jgi:hypothetical protein